ncbi:MAG TPA: OmpH family outer membrane protein [Pyrinomonadaceae bacterium]|jgi:Skp family chaperone for outer membrane proteins|nr:OmpH family outer membrane protein [Pyrinomonadaceae bacterium]
MKITVYGFIVLTFIGAGAASASAQIARPTPTPAVAARPTPTPAPANAPVPPSKIALVDTSMFGDEKNGIYRFVDATRAVAAEFKTRSDEVNNLAKRLTALANEVDALMKANPPNKTVIDAKQQQGGALQAEYDNKKAKLDEDLGKRYDQVVSPISRQIGVALDQFAAQRGVTMTLDVSKILPAILTVVPAADMTQAFINDFNAKNPRTAAAPAATPKP